ncbi:hypothetical protein HY642_02530 [Candidatus Woesearchaeota archaeon]|nr:hypothetical protein [Candidatus Woesearchaeota archaeon]
MKLTEYVGEYLLGTETIKFYRSRTGVLSEFLPGCGDTVRKTYKYALACDLTFGKLLPNLCTLAGAACWAYDKQPMATGMIIGGELARLSWALFFNKKQIKETEQYMRRIHTFSEALKGNAHSQDLDDLLGK